MTTLVIEQHIVATPSVRSGKPRIANTRITVADVVIWHFQLGYSPDEIGIKWELPLGAVYAAISYYYDHRNEIDEQIRKADAHHAKLKATSPSLLQKKLRALRGE